MIDLLTPPEALAPTAPPPVAPPIAPSPADARDLLAKFASTGHQDAFQEVMRRYGGMVFNLCFEITGNRQDAEDAVQAAFLSLAVQCRSGHPVQAIGPWLQQVARRMSLDINRARKRRKRREEKHGEDWEQRMTDARADGNGGSGSHGNPASAAGWEELRNVVQQELNQLPPKYRMPVILHYYGGLSRDEMARELNCKANTLGVRLHRGREMLAKRLAARGVTLSGVVLGVLMAEVVHSIVTDRMVQSTSQAAVLLSAGHPYACGVISPEIIAMAQTATRALASAKLRLACALTIFAGGAAAAGAQAVSHVTSWNVGGAVQDSVSRFFRNLVSSPAPRVDNKPRPTTPDGVPGTADANPAAAPKELVSPTNPAPFNLPPGLTWPREWIGGPKPPPPAINPQFVTPRLPSHQVVPYAPNFNNGPTGARPPTLQPSYTNNGPSNRSRMNNAPLPGGGSGGGSGGGGGSDNDSKIEFNPDEFTIQPKPKPMLAPMLSPSGGGVKHAPYGNLELSHNPHRSGDNGVVLPNGNSGGGTAAGHNRAPEYDQVAHNPWDHPLPPEVIPTPIPTPLPPTQDAQDVGPLVPPPNPGPPPASPDQVGASTIGVNHGPGGVRSGDVLQVSGEYVAAAPAETFEQVMTSPVGATHFHLRRFDFLTSPQVVVGYQGTGVAEQTGGCHKVDSLYLGVVKTGHGLYTLTGGTLRVAATPAGPDQAIHSIDVGSAGEGLFLLGDESGTGRITQTPGGGVDLNVGGTRVAKGTLRGWGTVELTGRMNNNGTIIADGYGQERTLDLTTFTSVGHDYANRTDHGWYAVNHAKLALPAIHVAPGANTYTWGGNNDEQLTLVNSARVTFQDAAPANGTGPGVVKIALLALDRADLPAFPAGHTLIGAWSFDPENLSAPGGMDLLVRYDDALAAIREVDEHVLKLWTHDDAGWHRLDFDPTFVRDPDNHTLYVHSGVEGVTHFAVSAPEPGTITLLAGGLGQLALRRRRRRV